MRISTTVLLTVVLQSSSFRGPSPANAMPVTLSTTSPLLSTIEGFWSLQPIEQLKATQFARTVRRAVRKAVKHLVWSGRRWAQWGLEASIFVLIAVVTPLFDRELLRTWREQGFAAFRITLALSLAVYLRLLMDSRSPLFGKGLLVLAVLYGMKVGDLVPDGWLVPLGLLDDVVAVGAASRLFMLLCPDALVEEHAVKAARAREKSVGERLSTDGTGPRV